MKNPILTIRYEGCLSNFKSRQIAYPSKSLAKKNYDEKQFLCEATTRLNIESSVLINRIVAGALVLITSATVYAQVISPATLRTIQRLAVNRLTLDRCVEHPDYSNEGMKASNLFLQSALVSSRLDRMVDAFQFSSNHRLIYISYSNILKQLKALQTAEVNSTEIKVHESIYSACDQMRIAKINKELNTIEKQIKTFLKL